MRRAASLHGVACLALAAATLASARAANAQEIRAWVEPQTVALGQTADIVVEVSAEGLRGGVDEPTLPPLDGARIVGRSRESRVSMSGARITRTAVYRYTVITLEPGVLTIDPIRAAAGGRTLETRPMTVLVIPGEPAPARLDRERTDGPPPVFAVTRLDRARAWVGQQIILTFSFYHDPAYPLAESPDYDPPEAPGFWRMEIDKEPVVSLERLGGRNYHVQRFRYALFPLRDGELEVGPATVRIVEPDGQRWWEPGPERTITTDALRVRVDPLPPPPPGFAGAVGSYTLEGTTSPRTTVVGTPIELELTVRGTGNPNAVGAPALPGWPDVEVRPPAVDASVDPAADGVRGEKRFRFLLVPGAEGRLNLGAARLPYFDPAAGAYRADTLRLGEIMVAARPPGALAGSEANARGPVLWAPRAPIARRGEVRSLAAEPWAWAALASPWAAWLLAAGMRAVRRRRPRDPQRIAAVRLGTAVDRLEREGRPALENAVRALDDSLAACFGRSAASGSPRARAESLAAAGASAELVQAVEEARSALGTARFAGAAGRAVPQADAARDAARALGRVTELLRRAGSARTARTGASLASLLLAGVLLAGSFLVADAFSLQEPAHTPELASTPAAARGAWQAANDAYRAGEFPQAARIYDLLLDTWSDPLLEADLAAALWRGGSPGEAYAHYLHALELAPRAGTIRADAGRLRAALGEPPDARGPLVRGLGRLTLGDLFLLVLILDLAAFAAFLVARRRSSVRWVAGALAGLLAFAVMAAILRGAYVERMALSVATDRLAVRAAPSDEAPPVDWLPAGSVMRVLERGDEAWRVRVPGRPAGWVARAGIVPLHSHRSHAK